MPVLALLQAAPERATVTAVPHVPDGARVERDLRLGRDNRTEGGGADLRSGGRG